MGMKQNNQDISPLFLDILAFYIYWFAQDRFYYKLLHLKLYLDKITIAVIYIELDVKKKKYIFVNSNGMISKL